MKTTTTIDEDEAKMRSLISRVRAVQEEIKNVDKELTILLGRYELGEVDIDKEIDGIWTLEAENRLEGIVSGAVQTVPGDEVMAAMRQKYAA